MTKHQSFHKFDHCRQLNDWLFSTYLCPMVAAIMKNSGAYGYLLFLIVAGVSASVSASGVSCPEIILDLSDVDEKVVSRLSSECISISSFEVSIWAPLKSSMFVQLILCSSTLPHPPCPLHAFHRRSHVPQKRKPLFTTHYIGAQC